MLRCLQVCLVKPKMYSFMKEDDKGDKNAKRITKDIQKMNHKEYINIIFKKKQIRHEMKRLQSKSQQSGTYKVNITMISNI